MRAVAVRVVVETAMAERAESEVHGDEAVCEGEGGGGTGRVTVGTGAEVGRAERALEPTAAAAVAVTVAVTVGMPAGCGGRWS